MNNLDTQYQQLLKSILDYGVEKKDRTGTGTKSIFGYTIRHNMKDGFPLLTTKKMAWKTMVVELLWFLNGGTNIKYLVDNGCHIWDGDAWANYKKKVLDKFLEGDSSISGYAITNKEEFIELIKTDEKFANEWGHLGPIYGKQWRDWNGREEVRVLNERDESGYLKFKTEHIKGVDQIQNLIQDLKNNPDSRRLMVSAWNVGDLEQMVLPPCHYGFQVYTRELSHTERYWLYNKISGDRCTPDCYTEEDFNKHNIPTRTISLMWNQRSVDTFLGLPFNIASYGLLLMLLGKAVNMVPEQLIGNLGDTHLYLNHIEQAKEQIEREPYELPNVEVNKDIFSLSVDDIVLQNYKFHSSIKAPLSN